MMFLKRDRGSPLQKNLLLLLVLLSLIQLYSQWTIRMAVSRKITMTDIPSLTYMWLQGQNEDATTDDGLQNSTHTELADLEEQTKELLGSASLRPSKSSILTKKVETEETDLVCKGPFHFDKESFPAKAPKKRIEENLERKQPRVCVIVPTFNVADYASTAIDSILNQTYQNVEVIVVDDHSSDGTQDLLHDKFHATTATKMPTVKVIRLNQNTNGGSGHPLNIGLTSCADETDFVMILDGDDFMELDTVHTLLTSAETFDSDIVMAKFDRVTVNEKDNSLKSEPEYDLNIWNPLPTNVSFNILTHPEILQMSPVAWRKLYRRSTMLQHDLTFPE